MARRITESAAEAKHGDKQNLLPLHLSCFTVPSVHSNVMTTDVRKMATCHADGYVGDGTCTIWNECAHDRMCTYMQ